MRRTVRRMGMMGIAVALAVPSVVPAAHNTTHIVKVAEGSVLLSTGGCYTSAECLHLMQTCDSSFAKQDGITASIVNIASSAGKLRDFKYISGTWTNAEAELGGHFLSAACGTTGSFSSASAVRIGTTARMKIPANTKWMAVMARLGVDHTWELWSCSATGCV